MLTYAEAESALAGIYKATGKAQAGAFRGRLKHLKRLGVPLKSNPGRGAKVDYGRNELWQWCFCLELSEFGIDPSLIVKIVKQYWPSELLSGFTGAQKELNLKNKGNDTYFLIAPEFMSASWSPPRELQGIGIRGFFQRAADLPNVLDATTKAGMRISIFNVSERLRELEKAFQAKKERQP